MESNSGSVVVAEMNEQLSIEKELEKLFNEHDFADILCDGRCATCLQRDWCLLTPAARCVK